MATRLHLPGWHSYCIAMPACCLSAGGKHFSVDPVFWVSEGEATPPTFCEAAPPGKNPLQGFGHVVTELSCHRPPPSLTCSPTRLPRLVPYTALKHRPQGSTPDAYVCGTFWAHCWHDSSPHVTALSCPALSLAGCCVLLACCQKRKPAQGRQSGPNYHSRSVSTLTTPHTTPPAFTVSLPPTLAAI